MNEHSGLGWRWDETAKRLYLLFEVSDETGVIGGLKTSLDGLPEIPPKENIDRCVAKMAAEGIAGFPKTQKYKPITWQEYLDGGWDDDELKEAE